MKLNFNYTSGDAHASGSPGTDCNPVTFGMQYPL